MKKTTHWSLLFITFIFFYCFMPQDTFWSHNAHAQKMRNNKRGKPGLSPALLCSVMECHSNPQLPWILCCMAAIQNKKPPSLYPWRRNPNGPFWWRGREQKTLQQSIFLTGSLMMSLDVGVCSRPAGKSDGGKACTVSLVLKCRWHVWHMLQRIIISPAAT